MFQLVQRVFLWGASLFVAVFVGACAPAVCEQQLQATVDALAARNAVLEAAQGTTAPAVPTTSSAALPATLLAGADAVAPTPVAPLVAAHAAAERYDNPVPRTIARIELSGGSAHLTDFRLDSAAQIAYLTDSDYTLYVVDLAAGEVVNAVVTSGDRLLLDAAGSRLYIMPDAPWARAGISPTVTLFDTKSRAIVGALPGSRASVDTGVGDGAGGAARLYIGDVVGFYGREAAGVRLYDATSLELLRTGPMAGNPLYDPAADGLIIQNSSVWTADAETLEPQRDLYPQITAIDLPGCNGCPAATAVFYFPEDEIIAAQTVILSPQGAGKLTSPDLYRAATMERFGGGYSLYATCSSQPQLVAPSNGRTLRTESFSRYVTYNNLFWEDAAGNKSKMRDGLRAAFVNPPAGVAYLQTSAAGGYVLDLATLAPVGMTDSLCFFAQDGANGLLYATDAERRALLVLEPRGGESKPPAPQPDRVAGKQVTSIVPSPDFARDGTLYLVAWALDEGGGQAILRSTDGGQSFTRLGGLPTGTDLTLTLAISPNFAEDQTLFAGGARREFMGEGVWKSTDGGDTWAPLWNGLTYLRVDRIMLSERFAKDQTLLAWAPYARISPMETGYSMQRSADGGLSWTTVMTSETEVLLPAASVYLSLPASAELPVRKRSWAAPIEFRIDNNSWMTATAALGADEILRAILPSPPNAAPSAILVATEAGVYRTLDGGRGWARLPADEMGNGALMAAAVTPLLGDGAYRLLLATADGEFLQLDPNTVAWEVVGDPEATEAAESISENSPVATADPALSAAATPSVTVATPAEQGAPAATPPPAITAAGLSAQPPAGLFHPAGIFGPAWEADRALQEALGFAHSEQPAIVAAAYQYFEHGVMVWRGDTQQIFAIYDDGVWDLFADTFKEGEAESDPSIKAPDGLMQPVRGFGKVWRSNADMQARLGWAVSKETGLNALVQDFEHGFYMRADAVEAALIQQPTGRRWQR